MKIIALFCVLIVQILALDNGVARLPPMGWNTWCTDDLIPCESDFCNEKEIMDIANAMATNGMKEAGYTYINLDDCWAGPRDENGDLTADPTRFPSGMKALADFVHSKGLLFGLYTCAGNLTCKFNRPGSWGHFEQDAATFASWGIDYVKMDWCFHPALSPQVVYPMMTKALNQTGRPIHFNLCEWGEDQPWLWAGPVGNSWRVGPDHMPFWDLPDTQQGTGDIIENMAGKSPYAGPGGWNDPDFLMTGIWTMTHLESMTEFSFWALFAAPLIVTTDIRDMSNKKDILLNTEVIAINQDPLGIAGDRIANYTNGGQIWTKPLSDGSYAVILYNKNWFESVTLTVNWSDVFDGQTGLTVSVRDLWKHQDVGQYTNSFTADVEGHGAVMLKCTPVS